MKKIILALLMASVLSGCVYRSTAEAGKDFDQTKISNIQKGKTTETDLLYSLGEPVKKEVISADETKWIYEKITSTAAIRVFSTKPKVDTKRKALEVLMKNGVVTNYAFTDNATSNYK
ncbi:hypothetical protein [Serratia ficaria]|uniref:hypothetical protein n=1 Tax=Serratia ficaria TaxID=61651 RepID=UPI00077C2D52|nr:hypothetical protein [Serratia ficaria]